MKKSSVEWGKIQELYKANFFLKNHGENLLTRYQQAFIDNLVNCLNEFAPFLEEQSEGQLRYLNFLYFKMQGKEKESRGAYDK